MKKLFIGAMLLLPTLLSAQNILKQEAFSFEPANNKVGAYWWIKQDSRSILTITNEKAADGKYSLKIDSETPKNANETNMQSGITNPFDASINMEEGQYEVSMQVWVESNPISFLQTNLTGTEGSKGFKAINWKLGNVEKGKWVELKQTIKSPEIKKGKMVIKSKGEGFVYIDNIVITKK